MKKTLVAIAALAVAIAVAPIAGGAGGPSPRAAEKAQTTEIQVLGLNDFHGNLRPPDETTSSGRIGAALPAGVAAGGVEHLATHVGRLRATNPNTLFVSAGDLIGASPLISAAFHDEPTIEAFNLLGLDYNGVGNHEFDEGVDELLRMQYGGCHPIDGCFGGDGFAGATFDFLAANVAYKDTHETIFAPYKIHHFNGVKVGIVGMTLEATPTIVTQSAVATIDFFDEADSVNALVPELKQQGVETIIVLLHEGGSNGVGLTPATINSCVNPTGPVVDVVDRMDAEIDVVVTGHTNWAVNCVRPDGKVVTGAASFGRMVTDIDLTVSRATKDVIREKTKVNNVIVTRDLTRTPEEQVQWQGVTDLVTKYAALAAPTENRVIGSATADLTRGTTTAGESVLGDIISDAQRSAGAAYPGGAQLAFMNAGGIRADINTGPITYGEAFTVQPFGNILVTMDMTGQQIVDVLRQQFELLAGATLLGNGILQVSKELTYTRTPADPSGQAGDLLSNVRINGVPIDTAATYRVALNNFLADGGDNFTVFRQGTNRFFGEIDLDAFATYLLANNPIAPTPRTRITLGP
jgi:5'-nucleotidase